LSFGNSDKLAAEEAAAKKAAEEKAARNLGWFFAFYLQTNFYLVFCKYCISDNTRH